MRMSRRVWLTGALAAPAGAAGSYVVWRRRRRQRGALPESVVRETIVGERRIIESNSVPNHPVGDFPNSHDPVTLSAQSLHYEMPAVPKVADRTRPLAMWHFGVALNGVPFDPSGPFWAGEVQVADIGIPHDAARRVAALMARPQSPCYLPHTETP